MATTFAQAAKNNDLDESALAELTGATPEDAKGWLTSGDLPDEHLDAVQDALGVEFSTNGSSSNGDAKKKSRSGSSASRSKSRRRNSVSADVNRGLRVMAALALGDEAFRAAAAELGKVEAQPEDTVEQSLVDTAEALLTLPKTTTDAIDDLQLLIEIENPIKLGLSLGKRDKRELNEVARVCSLLLERPEADLPSDNDEAAMLVVEYVSDVKASARPLLDKVVGLVR